MQIVGAIAFRPLALRRATAMITQMGFHAMPSGTWLEGCATQLVNPLSAFSLIAVRGNSHVRAGWTLPGRRPGPRPVAAVAPRPGHSGWTLRVFSVAERLGPCGACLTPRRAGPAGPRADADTSVHVRVLAWTALCAGPVRAAAGRVPGGRRPPELLGPPAPHAGRIPAGPAPGPAASHRRGGRSPAG